MEEPELLFGKEGPIWSRHYSDEPDEADCQLLDETLQILQAKKMIVGHTVQDDGITSVCGGKAWLIDVGLADAYGGPVEVLEIVGDQARVLHAAR